MLAVKHKHFAVALFVIALFGFALLAGTDAKAQEIPLERHTVPIEVICGETNALHALLAKDYGEYPIAMSINSKGNYLVWFVNEERTTFSIVSESGEGISCVLMAGSCTKGNCFIPNITEI